MPKKPKSKQTEEEPRKEPTPLTPPAVHERGPVGLPASTAAVYDAEKEAAMETKDPVGKPTQASTNIMDSIMGRLIKPKAFADPILAIEIVRGPYTGVVFVFKTFEVSDTVLENGMRGTTYETQVLFTPDHLGKDWTPDEGFDKFTSEVLFAWLSYVHVNSLAPLLKMKPVGGVQ